MTYSDINNPFYLREFQKYTNYPLIEENIHMER